VRVAIVEDHPILAESLASRFAGAGFVVVAVATDADELAPTVVADVVVCDLHLPRTAGVEAVGQLAESKARVVAVSGMATSEKVLDAVAAGARGYVEKADPPRSFVEAVAVLAGGGFYVSARLAGYLLTDAARRPLARYEIGPNERDLLRCLAQGDLVAEIAKDRGFDDAVFTAMFERIFDAARRRRRIYRPSPREAEVMVLLGCRGMSHRDAAAQMNVRPSVISDYLKSVKAKYLASHPEASDGVAPTTAALLWARELGYC
jgi:DNA-binding NarL/FixJ family response regulator